MPSWELGKKKKAKTDPRVAAAAEAQVALQQREMDWTESYYEKYITPMLEQQMKLADQAAAQNSELFAINKDNMTLANERYKKYGIPAEDRYYDMVAKYSAPEEEEAQAAAALGDMRVAENVNNENLKRRLAGLGIDPTSGAAVAAMSDAAVMNAANEASAQNRARQAAKTLGMSLTADAANFGRGGASGIIQFGSAAGANTQANVGAGATGLSAVTGATSPMMGAYGTGINMYGQQMGTYANIYNGDANRAQAESAGFGKLLGAGAQLGLKFAMSDRRLKKDIVPLSQLTNGLIVYQFSYVWDDVKHIGFMADEVEPLFPDAVHTHVSGYKMVDYSKVVI